MFICDWGSSILMSSLYNGGNRKDILVWLGPGKHKNARLCNFNIFPAFRFAEFKVLCPQKIMFLTPSPLFTEDHVLTPSPLFPCRVESHITWCWASPLLVDVHMPLTWNTHETASTMTSRPKAEIWLLYDCNLFKTTKLIYFTNLYWREIPLFIPSKDKILAQDTPYVLREPIALM